MITILPVLYKVWNLDTTHCIPASLSIYLAWDGTVYTCALNCHRDMKALDNEQCLYKDIQLFWLT